MGLCTLGLSGGVEVTAQLGGITLSLPGDFAVIQVSNAAPPGGPDVGGLFALSGSFQNFQIVPEFVVNPIAYGTDPVGVGGNWQLLQNTIRNDTNAYITGPFTPTNLAALQINLGSVAGLWAVRLRLVSIGSGSMLVSGNTNPIGVASLDAQILAQVQANAALNKAQLLGLADLTGVDYAAAYGITW